MESHNVIYQCQDKAYRLKWDEPLKGEIENIAVNEQDKRECRNAGALLELLRMLEQPEVYEIVDLIDARSFSMINQLEKAQQFKVYPNPANNFINIQTILNNSNVLVNIYDISGKLLINSNGHNTDYLLIDISALSGGLYLIEVISDSGKTEIQKLTIER